jgi:hypothetical protein
MNKSEPKKLGIPAQFASPDFTTRDGKRTISSASADKTGHAKGDVTIESSTQKVNGRKISTCYL